jgi:hypothetical protein
MQQDRQAIMSVYSSLACYKGKGCHSHDPNMPLDEVAPENDQKPGTNDMGVFLAACCHQANCATGQSSIQSVGLVRYEALLSSFALLRHATDL